MRVADVLTPAEGRVGVAVDAAAPRYYGQAPQRPEEAELTPPPEKPDWKMPLFFICGVFVLFLLVVLVLYSGGWLERPKDNRGTSTLGPVLVLLGTFLAQMIVGAGLVLRYSIDRRNYELALYEQKRLRIEEQRTYDLAAHEQQRVDIERQRVAGQSEIESRST